ncbi:MAG TPA: LysE family transporter [Vicinamibacterales bacterium]|nr:LysE family transporter [Vicinamibacterales bacterium]
MLSYLIFGASYAFAAAMQPGQLQAYLISRAIANGWRRTLPAALAPLLSDVPVIVLVLIVLTQVPPLFVNVLRLVGGVFLLYLAAGALRASRAGESELARHALPATAHRTFLEAVLVNVLNPNPYLGWALVLGPLLLEAWAKSPGAGIALLVAFYVTLVAASAGIVMLFALARSLGPRVARGLLGVSATALAAFGAYQLWAGARALL